MASLPARVAARRPFPLATACLTPISPYSRLSLPVHLATRLAHYQAFDAKLDEGDLAEARKWLGSFDESSLPRGTTVFARSSGPGGQHVNKTESKATTAWSVAELSRSLPKLVRSKLRSSRFYTARTDSLTFSAQTERHRSANIDENKDKLVQELRRIYAETVPGETDPGKAKKHAEVEKAFHNQRVKNKKHQSAKKQSRRSPPGE
ncbi:uncharacterized protein DNG_03924 [Cephalotrichum gorgonifer]|uniref:Prokaryotic-type class I peptide chain release factors domain-containing protein n=1 Tax=Cephalotrichum gorgonifer TaxID=2041049 RepID=A0AAE8MVM5_9PEZI|nr:uncharacterized protein DNG_03924 [Cephalotrichum gorgonifer]